MNKKLKKSIRINEEIDSKLKNSSKELKISETKLINVILSEFMNDFDKKKVVFSQFLPSGIERKIEKRILFTPSELRMIKTFAEQSGNTENQEILQRLTGTFSMKPVIAAKEFEALRVVSRLMYNVGTNINQIAKKLNQNQYDESIPDDLMSALDDVKVTLDVFKKSLYTIIEEATGRWHYEEKKPKILK